MPNNKRGDYTIKFTVGEKEIAKFKPVKSNENDIEFDKFQEIA